MDDDERKLPEVRWAWKLLDRQCERIDKGKRFVARAIFGWGRTVDPVSTYPAGVEFDDPKWGDSNHRAAAMEALREFARITPELDSIAVLSAVWVWPITPESAAAAGVTLDQLHGGHPITKTREGRDRLGPRRHALFAAVSSRARQVIVIQYGDEIGDRTYWKERVVVAGEEAKLRGPMCGLVPMDN